MSKTIVDASNDRKFSREDFFAGLEAAMTKGGTMARQNAEAVCAMLEGLEQFKGRAAKADNICDDAVLLIANFRTTEEEETAVSNCTIGLRSSQASLCTLLEHAARENEDLHRAIILVSLSLMKRKVANITSEE